MPPVTCAAKHSHPQPPPRLLQPPETDRTNPQSNYDVHFTDEEIEAQRCEATCSASYSQEATELCFPHVQTCAHL